MEQCKEYLALSVSSLDRCFSVVEIPSVHPSSDIVSSYSCVLCLSSYIYIESGNLCLTKVLLSRSLLPFPFTSTLNEGVSAFDYMRMFL